MRYFTFRLFAIAMLLVSAMTASGETTKVKVGDFKYEIDTETKEACLVYDQYYGLYDVTIPETITYENEVYTVTSLGYHAFFESKITSVVIPNTVTSIGWGAFSWCTELKKAVLPNSIKTIDGAAFTYCYNMESVNIPDNVEQIGSYAFNDCEALTSISIPSTLKEIQEGTFQSCIGIVTCNIPNGVTSIGWGAFAGCKSLESIVLPESLTYIGDKAFEYCKALVDITCLAEKCPEAFIDSFEDETYTNATLRVHNNSLSYYQNSSPWNLFKNYDDDIESNISLIENDNYIHNIYTMNGVKLPGTTLNGLKDLSKGIYIINGKKVAVNGKH